MIINKFFDLLILERIMLQKNLNGFQIYEFQAPNPKLHKYTIFFGGANGIPALTYKNLFEQLSYELNCSIITYDMRGFGKTTVPANYINKPKNQWTWETLTHDHVQLFLHFKNTYSPKTKWILSGHSLGSWLSLLATQHIAVDKILLLDPPILPSHIILRWSLIHILNKKHLSPKSSRVKRRKTRFQTIEHAVTELHKSSLMKNWPIETVYNYVRGSFSVHKNFIQLAHDPNWEAHMFEEYPFAAWIGFLKIPFRIRKNIAPIFFVGENSDTCNSKAKLWVKCFFPKLKWVIIPKGTHMFPFEMETETVSQIKHILHKD